MRTRGAGTGRAGCRRPRPAVAALLGAALLALGAGVARAQTPVTALGLGYPVPAVDGRAAALGGVGVGLLGADFSDLNPADLTSFRVATFSLTGSPQSVSLKGAGGGRIGRSGFPIMGVIVPVGSWAFGVQAGSLLDQDWSVRLQDTLVASSGRFPYVENRQHNGGVSTVDFSLARTIGPLSLGVGYDRLVGSLRQKFSRRFEVSVDSSAPPPATVSDLADWSYSGGRLRAGAGLELGERVRVSGAYRWSGDLHATRDSTGASRTFPMPDAWSAGASARPVGPLLLTVGGGWTGWSSLRGKAGGSRVRDTHWGGAGVEWDGWSLGSFPLALRAGGRYRQLPFWQPGEKPLDERALTFGLGMAFAGQRAIVDATMEVGRRGDRASTGVEETFRRFVLTASLRQVPIPGFLP